jgi:hypothetical protein
LKSLQKFALMTALTVALFRGHSVAQKPNGSWLDRPLASWNKPGATIPRAPASGENAAAVTNRCKLSPPRATAAERAVSAAGWIPFWNFDQPLVRDDVEIVGGMRGADGMCRPITYNLFVFVRGKFAGTLSPTLMISRTDGASSTVRIPAPDITAEFLRYADTDPLCCPTTHVTVRYRIDRQTAGPVVVPAEVRPRR